MRSSVLFVAVLIVIAACQSKEEKEKIASRQALAKTMETSLRNETLAKWYPANYDTINGGYLTEFTYDFKPTDHQQKMIVTQARHLWTTSKAAMRYPEEEHYKAGARLGFEFLRDKMWDKQFGGFYWLVERDGTPALNDTIKTAYGNAFAIYGLAAYYQMSKDPEALNLAKETFLWLEVHSHDPEFKGYFQHMRRNGKPIPRSAAKASTAETGYKDQNSSIHLLEAFTDLYQVWPDPLVKERLNEMLVLIRDTIVAPKGYLTLFLTSDFKPVSFADSSDDVILKHHHLDHVSFGHDVETAYLMIEASHALGIHDDKKTAEVAKRMVDHALAKGWDDKDGGFFDEGYYFKNKPDITITVDTKNWWAQAEGFNCLLMMSELYPDDPMNYYQKFEKLWNYCDKNLIDHENGDWFAGGIDRQPQLRTALKGQIWKACYHHYRSMANCIDVLNKE